MRQAFPACSEMQPPAMETEGLEAREEEGPDRVMEGDDDGGMRTATGFQSPAGPPSPSSRGAGGCKEKIKAGLHALRGPCQYWGPAAPRPPPRVAPRLPVSNCPPLRSGCLLLKPSPPGPRSLRQFGDRLKPEAGFERLSPEEQG